MTFGEVTYRAGEAVQFAGFVAKGYGDGVRPEARAVLARVPALIAEMALGGGAVQFLLRVNDREFAAGIEGGYVFADGLLFGPAINASRSRVPVCDTPIGMDEKQRVVLHPGWDWIFRAFLR